MQVYRLANGNLLAPKRAEGEGVIGDGMVEIGPDDPDYQSWIDYYERIDEEIPDREED